MGEVHKSLDIHGRDVVRRMDIERDVVEAAASYLSDENPELSFCFSGWAQAALPHKRQPNDAPWQSGSDKVSLMVAPGLRHRPGGEPQWVGVPYGARARLILLYLQTEALRTNSREVELGRSLNFWMTEMGIPIGGESARSIRDQADRISRCRISLEVNWGNRSGLVNQQIVDSALFIDPNDNQGKLSLEVAKLSEGFFEQLRKHPLPLEEKAIQALSNNSLGLDIYLWLAWRLHVLSSPTTISWPALKCQFGRAVNRMDHFRAHFRRTLQLAQAVYPEAQADVCERGVILHPSRPPVSPKQVAWPRATR
jgi:hypothetical protein